jgi:hypothetical protein
MDPIIVVPATGTTQLLAYAGQLFTDSWALIALAIGLPLAFYIITKVIGIVKGRAR